MKTILAVDPAVSHLGWAILTDHEDGTVSVVDTGMIEASKYASRAINREACERHSKRMISLNIISVEIDKLIIKYNPFCIAIEDAFAARFIHALIALVQVITTISWLGFNTYGLVSYRVPTKIAKKEVTGSGGKGKLAVEECIFNKMNIPEDLLITEHIADAIAVGYALIKKDYKIQK